MQQGDFTRFDYLIAMDQQNLADLHRISPHDASAQLCLLNDFDPLSAGDVPDPYYGGADGFRLVYEQINRACDQLIRQLL